MLTDEQKLDAARIREAWRFVKLPRSYTDEQILSTYTVLARVAELARLDWKPVDPDLVAARKAYVEANSWSDRANMAILEGLNDGGFFIRGYLAAKKAGQ